ncbi:hypothetical protein [Lysinibacillus sp. F5]|uniref:hypothetical protein n=1 Tax=Lysinibacillus sp. F5 TaxID=1700846 RepID=UPI0007389C2A|nr:hypothetical protein [Lysinibacillus sp. F5]KUF29970.1 hypothetical protein AK833_18060 [Lysinibacillus sp. F5]
MKKMIEDLLDYKQKIQSIFGVMRDIEDNLMGMELKYQGNYASIMYVDGNTQNVRLYVENEDGENWEVDLPLRELVKLVG